VTSSFHRRSRRLLISGFLALAATLAGYVAVQADIGQSSRAAGLPVPPPAVPVQIAPVARRDVPIYLQGLGTIQAYNTVVVRTQVDGELQQVAFTEGQKVKAGDLLAQIDPRPFQANYDQAVARKLDDGQAAGPQRADHKCDDGNQQRGLQRHQPPAQLGTQAIVIRRFAHDTCFSR